MAVTSLSPDSGGFVLQAAEETANSAEKPKRISLVIDTPPNESLHKGITFIQPTGRIYELS